MINSKKDDLLLEEIEKITPNSLEFDGTDLTLKMGGGAISTLLSVCEYGSNENGHFLKFENGTLICWCNTNSSTHSSWVYPCEFSEKPIIIGATGTVNEMSSYNITVNLDNIKVYTQYIDPSACTYDTSRFTMESSLEHVNFCVLGRWK